MKKIISLLSLVFLLAVTLSSCKSHGGNCAAYQSASSQPVKAPVKNL